MLTPDCVVWAYNCGFSFPAVNQICLPPVAPALYIQQPRYQVSGCIAALVVISVTLFILKYNSWVEALPESPISNCPLPLSALMIGWKAVLCKPTRVAPENIVWKAKSIVIPETAVIPL